MLNGFQTGEPHNHYFATVFKKLIAFSQVVAWEALTDAHQSSQMSSSGLILIPTNRACFLITRIGRPSQDFTRLPQ